MRIPTRMLVLALLIPVVALPASKQRDWQQGKLLDSNQSRVYLGTIGTANNQSQAYGTGTSGTSSGSSSSHHIAHYGFDDTYVIDSEKYVYVVMRMRKNRHSRVAHLIVNAPLRFAAEKGSMFVVG